MNLSTPLTKAGKVYQLYASRLAKLQIQTLEDMLYHVPFRYDDFTNKVAIHKVRAGDVVTITGQVLGMQNVYTKSKKNIQKALIADETGAIEIIWYNQPYITKYIKEHDTLSLSGKADFFLKKVVLVSPEYEIIREGSETLHTGRLVPIYPETKGVSSKWFRRQVYKLLQTNKTELGEHLPEAFIKKYRYQPLFETLKNIHFPNTLHESEIARNRLAYDELLLLQLHAQKRKALWERKVKGNQFMLHDKKDTLQAFETALPFALTDAQKNVVKDIFHDLEKTRPMNRLVQGDVGSGKTVVGAYAMYAAYSNNFQSVLMAPTEILAEQHYATIETLLSPFGIKTALVTGNKKIAKEKTYDIVVGTHAVLNKTVSFDKLGLVIIDEQQRFGVEQRSIIREKGTNPHFLTMTATPIPRTVALTMYGDLDISYISEMPKGRKMIKTWLVPKEKRERAYNWIRKQVTETDSQIFLLCPFIEVSETMSTVKAATVEFEHLRKDIFPDLKLGLIHGKMKGKEKDAVLENFRNRKYDILVSTPVVEVGIDIPNATVIMIEGAERFGLAQLHQLRGRVGRGNKQSYCLLFTENQSSQTTTRLKSLEVTHSGAELSEIDLKLRGPGDVFGTAQSGIPNLRIASFSQSTIVTQAKHDAAEIYPKLKLYPKLQKKMKLVDHQNISPD